MLNVRSLLHQPRVLYKIALGYGLSIGIVFVGLGAGLVVSFVNREQAFRDRDLAIRKAELVTRLENETLTLSLHPQYLMTTIDQSLWLRYEIAQFTSDISVLRTSLDKVEGLLASIETNPSQTAGLEIVADLRIFLDDYQDWAKSLWETLQTDAQTVLPGESAQQRKDRQLSLLVTKLSQPEAKNLQIRLKQLSEKLSILANTAQRLEEKAFNQFEASRELSVKILLGSFALSLVLAIICALRISRVIERPIREVTAQTHRITEEGNFDLRVSVDTNDEIGQLALSIDQLVQWAKQYTHELEDAQVQMVQSEKMSSLGQMVAGIAHEINNPVGFIYSNIDCATDYVQDLLDVVKAYRTACPEVESQEEVAELIEEVDLPFLEEDILKMLASMKLGADRIKEIVLSLRMFSRLDEAACKFTDIQEGLESTVTILGHRLKQLPDRCAIEIARDYGELPLVECYAGQLNQVFMNLIANAIDALEEGLTQGVSPRIVPSGGSAPAPQPQIAIKTRQQGDRCIITISDNGPGMPDKVRDRIFDPFFTTKPVGKGTGMGLSISYQVVTEKHGGQLSCTSQAGRGTSFVIDIPIHMKA